MCLLVDLLRTSSSFTSVAVHGTPKIVHLQRGAISGTWGVVISWVGLRIQGSLSRCTRFMLVVSDHMRVGRQCIASEERKERERSPNRNILSPLSLLELIVLT